MGLGTSHDCWHGAYSAFTRWRNTLAEAAEHEIVDIPCDRFGSFPGAKVLMHERWTAENFEGEWPDGVPEDPLLILLIHSDSSGVIKAEHAPWLAERLERLLPAIPEDLDLGGHIGNMRAKTEQFIKGLREAAEKGEDVEFG